MSIRVNPSVTFDSDTVHFLSTKAGEAIGSVPLTPALRRLLAADEFPQVPEKLVEAGLLQRFIPVPDQGPDRLAAHLAWLDGLPGIGPAIEPLRRAHDTVRRFEKSEDPAERAALAGTVALLDNTVFPGLVGGITHRTGTT